MADTNTYTTDSAQESEALGATIARDVISGKLPRILCLYGPLGAGKTTFTRGFIRESTGSDRVTSPTFILMKEYDMDGEFERIVHVDLYRLEEGFDPRDIGILDTCERDDTIVLIEWADRMGSNLPSPRLDIVCRVNTSGQHIYRSTLV